MAACQTASMQLLAILVLVIINVLENAGFAIFHEDLNLEFGNHTMLNCSLFRTDTLMESINFSPTYTGTFLLSTATFILPIFGGSMTDSCLGSKNSLLIGSAFYLISTILYKLYLNHCEIYYLTYFSAAFFICALALAKPAIITLMSDVYPKATGERGNKEEIFLLYYISLSVGYIVGNSVSYVESEHKIPLLFDFCIPVYAVMIFLSITIIIFFNKLQLDTEIENECKCCQTLAHRRDSAGDDMMGLIAKHEQQSNDWKSLPSWFLVFVPFIALSLVINTLSNITSSELTRYLKFPKKRHRDMDYSIISIANALGIFISCFLILLRLRSKPNSSLTSVKLRIKIGFVLSAFAMLIASVIEIPEFSKLFWRFSDWANLVILLSISPCLLGAAEGLSFSAMCSFIYSTSQRHQMNFKQALLIGCFGCGSLLAVLLTAALQERLISYRITYATDWFLFGVYAGALLLLALVLLGLHFVFESQMSLLEAEHAERVRHKLANNVEAAAGNQQYGATYVNNLNLLIDVSTV